LIVDNEARISAVQALNLLDTDPELAFEDAVQLAATICATPISLITVLDGKRQWFKSRVGLKVTETPQEQAFCAHAITQSHLFIVEDASKDVRFEENPLVTGYPNIRFYAGMPLRTPDGYSLGTLCVIDTVPRVLTKEQGAALKLLARQIEIQITMRRQVKGLNEAITAMTRFHEQVVDSNALFQAFMDYSPLVGFMKDDRGRFLYYNRLFAERFAITREEWIGKDDFEIFTRELAEGFRAVDQAVLREGMLRITEETLPGPADTTMHWRTYKYPFEDASGGHLLAGVSLDISAEKDAEIALKNSNEALHHANERLRELSVTDSLTGLSNRRGFDEQLQHEFKTAARYRSAFSMLLIDVDDFKSFNDTFGHTEGDEVLRQVASLLLQGARDTDFVYRHGGEEFAVLLPNTTLEAAGLLGQRICRSMASGSWKHRGVTVSVGAAASTGGLPNAAALVRRADLALYEAKAHGKNRTVPYVLEMQPKP
jgi:diguanylate cyclase (GGDEF)-like protein/PAS domain S-box-containing protein